KVIPALIENKRQINIWSAACSTGEEPYSLAILLREHFPQLKVNILATDLDDKALAKAKQGAYGEQSLKDLPSEKKAKNFTFENNKYKIKNKLKQIITYMKHNILNTSYHKIMFLHICHISYIFINYTPTIYH